jgi:toxin FitB
MSGFLLDTNVVSELIRPRPDSKVTGWIEQTDEVLLFLSVLTLGEIRKGIASQTHASRRAALQSWLEGDLRPRFKGRILPVTDEVAERWGTLAGLAKTRGTPVPIVDALLAATALEHNLTLVTRNAADVSATGATVFNPWEP